MKENNVRVVLLDNTGLKIAFEKIIYEIVKDAVELGFMIGVNTNKTKEEKAGISIEDILNFINLTKNTRDFSRGRFSKR